MGWQTIAAYGAAAIVALGGVYMAFRMIRGETRRGGEAKEARETVETMVKEDARVHKLAGLPIPMSVVEQLSRLRRLRDKVLRRKRGTLSDDE